MCGFIGLLEHNCRAPGQLIDTAALMADTIKHRGPDDSGLWSDESVGIALGFRRLAIIDLSSAGHQPMHSASGRYTIVFNGEIYNFKDLRRELEDLGHRFRGHSDTEVILTGIEQWGVQKAVERFVGMFAIALWNRNERKLVLIRDRLGIKPLYYGWVGQSFLCGSELKAICAYPNFTRQVDRRVLSLYLRHSYVPTPYSIYQGIYKLPPGCILEVRMNDSTDSVKPLPYWSAKDVAADNMANRFHESDSSLINQLDELLREAIRIRMVADVPLGAFLSGGIDSSLVVALMQAQSNTPIKTFTIGFNEKQFNEAKYAKAVANHLCADHTELYVTASDARSVIPRLPEIFDEPFADASQIPTFLVSELTKRHVTVSLSGDGGDELFGGYPRFQKNAERWRLWGWCHPKIRRFLGGLALVVAGKDPLKENRFLTRSMIDRLRLEARLISQESREAMYRNYISSIFNPAEIIDCRNEPSYFLTDHTKWPPIPNFYEQMMYLDTVNYLPDDILTKVDRASMAVSLEARVPLLDHRVVEFAWRLPFSQKFRDGQGKWILRQVLDRYVPREIFNRPKMGFAVPVESWMRDSLRDWTESLLDERKMNDDGFFDARLIRSWWKSFLKGQTQWQPHLWGILMFQAWRNRWL
jgi:asparagine synthase (glutamine-hydrolysing)